MPDMSPRRTSSDPDTAALFVRLPATEARKLDRAAHATGAPKKDLVAGLVARYVDPDTDDGLHALRRLGAEAPGALPPPPPAPAPPGPASPRGPRARSPAASSSSPTSPRSSSATIRSAPPR